MWPAKDRNDINIHVARRIKTYPPRAVWRIKATDRHHSRTWYGRSFFEKNRSFKRPARPGREMKKNGPINSSAR